MNEKANVSSHATRQNVNSNRVPATQRESGIPATAKRGAANSGSGFSKRQARTDAAVRTIPGLHNFGN